jgi:hypothetical protein
MSTPEQFDFESYEHRPSTPEEIAALLPSSYKYYLGCMEGVDERACLSIIALLDAQKYLAELGIIDARKRSEQRQEAWDAADWDVVARIDRVRERLGKSEDFLDTKLTALGLEVISLCGKMNLQPPQ